MRSLSLPLVLGSLLLVACSSEAVSSAPSSRPDSQPQQSVDDIVNRPSTDAAVCSTLDYNHQKAAADYFRFFDTDAAAAEYMTKLIARGTLANNSGPEAKLREISADERLNRLVREVFDGFKKTFPKEMTGLTTPPRIAVVESSIVNAFALGPGFAESDDAPQDRSPYLFIVHTAILKRKNTDTELRGLFAHELGHLLLRTFLPEIQKAVRSIYIIGKAGEDGVIGAVQDDDPRVAEHVEKILKIQQREGGLGDLGFPVLLAQSSMYMRLFGAVARSIPASAACESAKTKMDALRTLQKAYLKDSDVGNFVPAPRTPAQQAELEVASAAAIEDYKKCLAPANDNGSIMSVIAQTNGVPVEAATDPAHPDHQKLKDLMVDIELAVDAEMPNAKVLDRLFVAEARMRAELVKLRSDPAFPIEKIRVFDYEEDADDASVRVLASIGDDPRGVGHFLISTTPEAAQEKCRADIANGVPISYGQFIDMHPSICWRLYHVTQLGKALNMCAPAPVSTPASLVAKSGGRASVLDRVPHVATGYGVGER